MSPTMSGEFFTTSATWEAHFIILQVINFDSTYLGNSAAFTWAHLRGSSQLSRLHGPSQLPAMADEMPTSCWSLMESSPGSQAWKSSLRTGSASSGQGLELSVVMSTTFRWSKQILRTAWIQEWPERFYWWMGGIEQSPLKEMCREYMEEFAAVSCNLPLWVLGKQSCIWNFAIAWAWANHIISGTITAFEGLYMPNIGLKSGDIMGFPCGSKCKESACNPEDLGSISEWGRCPGERNDIQDSCLENSMKRGAWQALIHGVAKSQTQLSN